jgi:hypothetical protein
MSDRPHKDETSPLCWARYVFETACILDAAAAYEVKTFLTLLAARFQVGIQCRHCVKSSPKLRARGAVYFPSKWSGIYQAAQVRFF